MLIANPIYDVVFKRLMENERVAKFFIGTLLEQAIESVEVRPQEFTYSDEGAGLAILRLDFIATVRAETGELKKVLIEIQKARNQIDLMRFRRYLASQYRQEDRVGDKKKALPITTIYILGFKLPEIETPCIKVERKYLDMVNKRTLATKCDFVEKLTHDSYVVQVERITDRYQTRLDKLLSVFEQRHFADDQGITKEYRHPADLADVRLITDILHHAGTDPEERKLIEDEQEAWRTFTAMFEEQAHELIDALNKKDKILKEKEMKLVENRKVIKDKDKKLDEKDKELEEKDLALERMARELEEMRRKLEGK